MNPNQKLQWQALEYEERERGRDWFWALGVIVVASTLTAIIYSNYFFAVLVILGGALLGYFAKRKPEAISYELNDKGFRAGRRLYPYENISSFFVQREIKPLLLIKSGRFFMPIISSPIDPDMAEEIHVIFVSKNIPEEELKEHTSETIMDSLGF